MTEKCALAEAGLDETHIADYLASQPDFFVRHPQLLDALRLPHEQRGSVSLVEARMERQRQRIHQLEEEITQLMTVAGENERIFRVYLDLYPRLFDCRTPAELEQRIAHALRERLRVTAVRLVPDARWCDLARALPGEQLDKLYRERMAGQDVYLGRLGREEKQRLFGDTLVNSCALIRIGARGEMGLLAFGSADSSHYRSGMDTLIIRQLAGFLALLLPRMVEDDHA